MHNHKIVCYFNMAAHYNALLYEKMDKQFHCDFVFGEKLCGIKEMDLSKLHGYKFTARRKFYFGDRFWKEEGAFKYISDQDYDTIIINPVTRCLSSWRVILWAKFHNKKVIYYGHGYYGKENQLATFIKKVVFSWCDAFLLYGEYAKNLMIQKNVLPAEKMFPIFNSMNYDEQLTYRQTTTSDKIYLEHFNNADKNLIFVGRLTPEKELSLVIKALSILNMRGEHFNFTVIGDGPEKENLQKFVFELKLETQVWFYGPCYDEKELSNLIYNGDLCVSPGNVGLTAMHSMMYGTPVISHNNFKRQGPEFEAIEEEKTGLFFKQSDAESLCESIDKWMKLNQDRDLVREHCFNIIDTKYNTNIQMKIIDEALNYIWSK